MFHIHHAEPTNADDANALKAWMELFDRLQGSLVLIKAKNGLHSFIIPKLICFKNIID